MKEKLKYIIQYGGIVEVIRKTYRFILRSILGIIVKFWVKGHRTRYGLNNSEKRKKRIIISMTTYPARFSTIDLCIKSLLLQTVKPDAIEIWLGCDVRREMLTETMKEYMKYGVNYNFVSGNLKPHKKYFYAFTKYNNDLVITVDDDAIYSPFLVSTLMKSYNKYPDAVSARRVHEITYKNQSVRKYNEWKDCTHYLTKPSHSLFATGGGGILYSPNLFKDERMLNSNLVESICLNADDIWLKHFEVLQDIKVVWAKCILETPYMINHSQNETLMAGNVKENRNDYYIKRVQDKIK